MNYVPKFDSGLLDGLGSFAGARGFSTVDVQSKSTTAGPDAIVVPDAQLLFSGEYKRSGLDLVLSKDGHEFAVRDYFRGETRATLASPDGASLSGKTVSALTGQVDYAQAGGAVAAAEIIGRVTKLTGSATAIRNGVSITLNVGENVHKGDVVQSGSDSSLGITFVDGTVFGLSANARMVLNEMVYDPNGSGNSSLLTLVQGTISFVAGATAKNGGMKVDTPTATMGIRGTAVLVEIDFDIQQPGLAPPVSFRVLVEPNGTTGEYVLLDKTTLQQIAIVNQAGTKTTVNGQGAVTFIASAPIPGEAQRLINEIFALKFTDANPKDLNIPPLDSITPQSFFVKLTDGTPYNQLPIFVTAFFLETPPPPPTSGGNHAIPSQHSAGHFRLRQQLYRAGRDHRQRRAGYGVRHHPLCRHQSGRPSDRVGTLRFLRLPRRPAKCRHLVFVRATDGHQGGASPALDRAECRQHQHRRGDLDLQPARSGV